MTNTTLGRREVLSILAGAGLTAVLPRRLAAFSIRAPVVPVRVNGARLNASLTRLSEFGKNPQGGVTRLAYSDADLAARDWAVSLMREIGLETRIDAAGNIIGRRAGTDAARRPILFGS